MQFRASNKRVHGLARLPGLMQSSLSYLYPVSSVNEDDDDNKIFVESICPETPSRMKIDSRVPFSN